jgi:hypothetical protein
MITLQGKKYLPVAPRLAWLREHHPDAIITTEIVEHNAAEKWCIIRATIQLPTGGSATGMARQEPTRIAQDYIANGETSSIGRALAALGYGTLTAIEFDQGEQVVDAPVERRPPPTPAVDADTAAAREALALAMKVQGWSLPRVIETAGWVWPHIQTRADLGTLTSVQLARLTEVVTGESVVNLDVHGVKRIMPAAVAIGMAS